MIKNILSIAGSDPTGGAGIQADIKAISANGGYAMTVITALVAQNTQGVQSFELVSRNMIAQQIKSVFDDVQVDAVKIGMLGNAEIIQTVAEQLKHYKPSKIVLDPVMVAKSGDRLLAQEAVSAMKSELMPLVHLITPNLPEAADLLEEPEAQTIEEMTQQARKLGQTVFLKGGHLTTSNSPDLLIEYNQNHQEYEEHWLESQRISTKNTHGTGCTLSASIATNWAKTDDLFIACEQSKNYLSQALAHADELNVGSGHGPVHHFQALHSVK